MKRVVIDGYIVGLSQHFGEDITEHEYQEILAAIDTRPEDGEDFYHRLRIDLVWEKCEKVIVEEHHGEEMTETEQKAQAYDILTGVSQ